MEPVPSAKEMILRFIEKGIAEPTFAPVHLTATLSSVDANIVSTDIARAGESLWHGQTYYGLMKGFIKSYPKIDLSVFPWKCPQDVSFQSVRTGELLSNMQEQIDTALASLPFQMRPVSDNRGPWRNAFSGEEPLNRYFYFELFRESVVPEWITGLDEMQMSGSWRVFLPDPSPELDLIDKIRSYERSADALSRLEAAPAASIPAQKAEVQVIQEQITESLSQLAA